MLRNQLIHHLNHILRPDLLNDYCPNGLQVEGSAQVNKIVTGVTASMALIEKAIALNADTILVHHGYFWKGESPAITGMKQKRIKALLSHNINLIAYHLPLDVHPELGNNAQLGKLLNISNIRAVEGIKPKGIVMQGDLEQAANIDEFADMLEQVLVRTPTIIPIDNKPVHKVAWCTGGGQSYIDQIAGYVAGQESAFDIDLFISGEISEQTQHSALEQDIHYIAAGHHATERYGAKALGEHLAQEFDLDVHFIDCANPA